MNFNGGLPWDVLLQVCPPCIFCVNTIVPVAFLAVVNRPLMVLNVTLVGSELDQSGQGDPVAALIEGTGRVGLRRLLSDPRGSSSIQFRVLYRAEAGCRTPDALCCRSGGGIIASTNEPSYQPG